MTLASMRSFMFAVATLLALMSAWPDASNDEEASVHLTVEDSALVVRGLYTYHGEEESTRDYMLEVHREGAAGSSASTQGGSFTSTPGHVDTLGTSRVSVSEGDRLIVELTVRAGETTVATASVDCVYPGCLDAQNEQ